MAEDAHHHPHGQHDGHNGFLHGHKDGEAFTEANRAHWNDFAAKYSSEQWQRDMLKNITAFIHQNINWIGVDFLDPSTTFEKPSSSSSPSPRTIRVLDYACGPGTITHALGARATEYIGMDLSENMVQAYNLRFNPPESSTSDKGGIYDSSDGTLTAHAVVGNLLDNTHPPPPHLTTPEFSNFDLVVVGLGFHHFQDIPLATRRLVDRLRVGGVFLILDFVTHAMDEKLTGQDGKGHDGLERSKHTVAHAGFSEGELKGWFEGAGLEGFKVVRMEREVMLGGTAKRRPFLARGVKL